MRKDAVALSHLDHNSESGFSIIEALVSIVVLAILTTAITGNLLLSLRTAKLTEVNHAASSLAVAKMEELAAVNVADLDDSFNGTETEVAWEEFGFTFSRQTTVTVNADQSRTVDITVSSNHPSLSSDVTFRSNFALW